MNLTVVLQMESKLNWSILKDAIIGWRDNHYSMKSYLFDNAH